MSASTLEDVDPEMETDRLDRLLIINNPDGSVTRLSDIVRPPSKRAAKKQAAQAAALAAAKQAAANGGDGNGGDKPAVGEGTDGSAGKAKSSQPNTSRGGPAGRSASRGGDDASGGAEASTSLNLAAIDVSRPASSQAGGKRGDVSARGKASATPSKPKSSLVPPSSGQATARPRTPAK